MLDSLLDIFNPFIIPCLKSCTSLQHSTQLTTGKKLTFEHVLQPRLGGGGADS